METSVSPAERARLLQSDDPDDFMKLIRMVVLKLLADEAPRITQEEDKAGWINIVDGFVQQFLSSFIKNHPDATLWNELAARINLIEPVLRVIKKAFARVDGLCSIEGLVKKVFRTLLALCNILDVWIEANMPCEDGLMSPEVMKVEVVETIVDILREVGNNNSFEPLRDILHESVEVCQDLIASTVPLANPLLIAFFETPRIIIRSAGITQDTDIEQEDNTLIVPATRIPSFLTFLLQLMYRSLARPMKARGFLIDITRRLPIITRLCIDYCISPGSSAPAAERTQALASIATIIKPAMGSEYRLLTAGLFERLMQLRLDALSKLDWSVIDAMVSEILANEEVTVSASLIHSALYRLEISDEHLQNLICSYLSNIAPRLGPNLRSFTWHKINALPESPQRTVILKALNESPKHVSPSSHRPMDKTGYLLMPAHAWRQKVCDIVQEIVGTGAASWMDDDDQDSVPHLCRRALFEVENMDSKTGRLSGMKLIEALADLTCLLAMCDKTDCAQRHANDKYLSITPFIHLITRVLEADADNALRAKIFRTMEVMLKHHTGDIPEVVVEIIFRGIADEDRSVRISAGNALKAVMFCFSNYDGNVATFIIPIFTRIYECFNVFQNHLRETLLVSIGSMGKTTHPYILGQVLCILTAQLGRNNLVIRGKACCSILELAKFHNKTPYSLILPYLDDIAPFIAKRFPSQPDLLVEACGVMAITPTDFIAITLPRTLPSVFATCDQKVLNTISKELGRKPSSMLLKHCHIILAHIFLLANQASTTKALNFVIEVLSADAPGSAIDIQSVVRSCVVPLLAALVVVMGDENKDVAQQGAIALKRVENVLTPATTRTPSPSSNLGAFLKNYMLGLISDINDMLQDVQGKKTVTEKRKILRCLGSLVDQIGPPISHVSPQIMATFQTMVSIPELSKVTMESWYKFLSTLGPTELGPHIGPTSAAIVASWNIFSPDTRDIAFQSLEHIICTMGLQLQQHLGEIVDLSVVEELHPLVLELKALRGTASPPEDLDRILCQAASDNLTVATQSLQELRKFMSKEHPEYMRQISSGDVFDPVVGRILATLFSAACRDSGEAGENLRLLAFDCIGVLGAMDPDRCEIPYRDTSMVVLRNYAQEDEATDFAIHLIQDLLVGAFRSTSDIKYQSHLAYSIQELLKFCQFTRALVAGSNAGPVHLKHLRRWNALPKHVLETVTPLLEGRFTLNQSAGPDIQHPIYPTQSTYREWIQLWASYLITIVSGPTAQKLFGVFRSAVRNKDVVVAHHLLPHLVLNILLSGNEDHATSIRTEIITVLNDQVNPESSSTSDKKLLSAQAIFMLLDHLNKWIRQARQELSKKPESKRARTDRGSSVLQDQLIRLDSILLNIDQGLMARAAFKCKAYARSLMNFEQQILLLQERESGQSQLPDYYDRLHEIYAHLDEPDGMEGISTMILSPSLEHTIRQHESTGKWTSAQSCWEVRLQQSPDNVDFHIGLLRCLRNLGHYDTLRTHVIGVLTRHPEWETTLAGFQAESAWMVGAWDDVQTLVERVKEETSSMATARVLLAMRTGEDQAISNALSHARSILGASITAGGIKGYRRSYDAVLDLHMIHELELIYEATRSLQPGSQVSVRQERRRSLNDLSKMLASRLEMTLPTFRSREPLLSMRRTAFALAKNSRDILDREIGKTWLASAKIARKANQGQTAYSAFLQAQERNALYAFVERAKQLKKTRPDNPLLPIDELERSIKQTGLFNSTVLDLTVDAETQRMKAKILVLQARWMHECNDRFEDPTIFHVFNEATALQKKWETAHYYLGHFHDECFKALPPNEQTGRGLKMNAYTVKCFGKAVMHGSKFVYQTVPRMLTIWLDLGENATVAQQAVFKKMTDDVTKTITVAPVYKWYTAFPQIVSRVAHENLEVFKVLSKLIAVIMATYPRQSLWLFTSVIKSTKPNRNTRGRAIMSQLRNNPQNSEQVSKLVSEAIAMTEQLLKLCDLAVDGNKHTLSMAKDIPSLKALSRSSMIIPLQESLTASLPPDSTSESTHQPFPPDTPTFHDFFDEIEIMKSLAKPRKITVRGSNGQIYMFLGKPKDDLRKDARLMDLNSIINKLLKGNSESRRRQLHIRTYGVVALNEECGFIQWVPNTVPIRPVLNKYYQAKRIPLWSSELAAVATKISQTRSDDEAVTLFQRNILGVFKPVLHEWFIETFPEPTAWLASRLTYGRTAAVMSMVGFILGLGDRHCENILLDTNSGDVVHVDFNCLFERGKLLDTPERVPFRLTQNIVDGLGISGVEGVFRIACEVTMQLLRDNRDSLMSVLDAFVHDPLVEWEDEKRRMERKSAGNQPRGKVDTIKGLAKNALHPIGKKLKGIYVPNNVIERSEKAVTTSNLVQMLIQEATSPVNLSRMYVGWAPWH